MEQNHPIKEMNAPVFCQPVSAAYAQCNCIHDLNLSSPAFANQIVTTFAAVEPCVLLLCNATKINKQNIYTESHNSFSTFSSNEGANPILSKAIN